jgi:hypothetical protein
VISWQLYIYIFMVSGFLTTSQRPTAPPLGPRSAEIRGLRRVAVQVGEQRIDPAGRPQRSTLKGGDFFKQNWFRWGKNWENHGKIWWKLYLVANIQRKWSVLIST